MKHRLNGAVARKKYLEEQKKRNQAAMNIQKKHRGATARAELQNKKKGAISIQKTFRGQQARKLREAMLLQKAMESLSNDHKKATIIQRCVYRWLLASRARKLEEMETDRITQEEEAEKRRREQLKEQTEAALKIQTAARGKTGRKMAVEKKQQLTAQQEQDRQKKLLLATFNEVEQTGILMPSRPLEEQVLDHWVCFNFNKGVRSWGKIEEYNDITRVINVLFKDSGEKDMYLKAMSFDHPMISWILPMDKVNDELGEPNDNLNETNDDVFPDLEDDNISEGSRSMELVQVSRPDLKDAQGNTNFNTTINTITN